MLLTIRGDSISSLRTSHTAHPAPGHEDAWHVSWLPGRLLDRQTAITAMLPADAADVVPPGHQSWSSVEGRAAKLGLTGPGAHAWADRTGIDKDAAITEDPEAAG